MEIRPEFPVILTIGDVRLEDEERARAAGIREVVLKPDTADELGTILDRMFRCG